ncbi:MAG: ATP-binding protein [Opitutae bacterium]|nr:ATP-binding protein [Opitutae bacterium]
MIEWSMANDSADLERTLDEVDARLAALDVSAKRKYAVRLALDELLSNVIRYAYDDGAVHRIGLKLETGEPFALTIDDDGKPFDPLADAPAPVLDGPVEDRPIGGLGLHILKQMGLKLDYRREAGRNVLRVVFPGE